MRFTEMQKIQTLTEKYTIMKRSMTFFSQATHNHCKVHQYVRFDNKLS